MVDTQEHTKAYGFISVRQSDHNGYSLLYCSDTRVEGEGLKNTLTLHWGKRFLLEATLPPFIKPVEVKNNLSVLDPAAIEQLGRESFYDYYPRWYGFSVLGGFLQWYYGRQNTSRTPKRDERKHHWFLPWREYRLTGHLLLDPKERVFWDRRDSLMRGVSRRWNRPMPYFTAREKVPKHSFWVEDSSGYPVAVHVHIEVRTWRKGIGRFRCLSWFTPAVVKRTLEIEFLGHPARFDAPEIQSIRTSEPMFETETAEDAFRRYCGARQYRDPNKPRYTVIGNNGIVSPAQL